MTDRRTFLYEDFEISYEDTKKGWSMPYSHHHTNYEIYILLSGERLVTIGDITYRVETGMENMIWTWWYYPQVVSLKKTEDKVYWGFTTKEGNSGVAEYDNRTGLVKKNILKVWLILL